VGGVVVAPPGGAPPPPRLEQLLVEGIGPADDPGELLGVC